MDNFDARFLLESERRRGEMAVATQHRLVKEAQRAGGVLRDLVVRGFPGSLRGGRSDGDG